MLALRDRAAAYLREPRGKLSDLVLEGIAAGELPVVIRRPGVCACGVTYRGRAIAPLVGDSSQWLADRHAQAHTALVVAGVDADEGDAWRLTELLLRAEPSNSQRLQKIVRASSQK
mgnify:CR=1 FL=1